MITINIKSDKKRQKSERHWFTGQSLSRSQHTSNVRLLITQCSQPYSDNFGNFLRWTAFALASTFLCASMKLLKNSKENSFYVVFILPMRGGVVKVQVHVHVHNLPVTVVCTFMEISKKLRQDKRASWSLQAIFEHKKTLTLRDLLWGQSDKRQKIQKPAGRKR